MPSGRVHDSIAYITSAAAAPVIALKTPPIWQGFAWIALISYLLGSIYLSDDLDLDSRPYRRWGPLRCLWWPYQKMLPHRCWLSHGIAIGPFFRIVYFITVLFIVGYGTVSVMNAWGLHVHASAHSVLYAGQRWVERHLKEVMAFLLGLFLAGLAHSVADTVTSTVKKAL